MDALFGEGVIVKDNTTIGGTFGAEKVVKGELQAGTEFGKESPGTRTTLHARIEGMLTAKAGWKPGETSYSPFPKRTQSKRPAPHCAGPAF